MILCDKDLIHTTTVYFPTQQAHRQTSTPQAKDFKSICRHLFTFSHQGTGDDKCHYDCPPEGQHIIARLTLARLKHYFIRLHTATNVHSGFLLASFMRAGWKRRQARHQGTKKSAITRVSPAIASRKSSGVLTRRKLSGSEPSNLQYMYTICEAPTR